MSRDKQNDEMRYLADEMGKAISTELEKRYLADERKLEEVLKANGWCKASDLAEEIFAEIEASAKVKYWRGGGLVVFEVNGEDFAELKKKYIGKDTNVTTKESEKDIDNT